MTSTAIHNVEMALPAPFSITVSCFYSKNKVAALVIYLPAVPLDVTLISFSLGSPS